MKGLALLCLILPTWSFGQSITVHQELQFAKYLMDKKYFDEATYTLEKLLLRNTSTSQTDTINYWLGNTYYSRQLLEKSNEYFDRVSTALPRLKSESAFFSAFNSAYLRSFDAARQKLLTFTPQDSAQQILKNFELAGIHLLQRNFNGFDSLSRNFSNTHFWVSQQQQDLIVFRDKLHANSKKSPFQAGLLSALVPGAGKFYAGYKGQGFLNFVVAALLGVQAWEGYHKAGPESFRFIAYATLFTTFYISTIWGSVLAVKIKQNEISKTLDAQILFDLHIPIRSAFH